MKIKFLDPLNEQDIEALREPEIKPTPEALERAGAGVFHILDLETPYLLPSGEFDMKRWLDEEEARMNRLERKRARK